jgi:hypothetical protein
MVNAINAMRGGNFTEYQLQSLPLPGIRTFDSLALLVPGVAEAPEAISLAAGPGIGSGLGSPGQFSVNGMRSRANSFTVDGSDNNDQDVAVRRQGYLALLPQPIESVQEFQVSALLWDAEQGRNLGSQVNAVSKSGTNHVHGQLYGYLTDSRLNARNFYDGAQKNPYTRSQAGFDLAGPLVRDKTHFFASFENQTLHAIETQHFASPRQDERTFQGLSKINIYTPAIASAPNYQTAVGATPLGLNLLATKATPSSTVFYPLPNDPGGPYGSNTLTQFLPSSGEGRIFSLKVTHQFNERNQLAARYNFTNDDRELPSVKRAINSSIDSGTRNQNLSLILDTALSDTLMSQARVSIGRTRLNFSPLSPLSLNSDYQVPDGAFSILSTHGNYAPTSSTYPLGELIIRPFSPVGLDSQLFPQCRTNNTYQFADSISRVWQRHTLKFGADIRRVQFDSRQDRYYRPSIQVNNGLMDGQFMRGIQFAAIGQVSSVLQTITKDPPDSTIGLRFTEVNLFLNDNFRVSPHFALDYGVRYEYNTVPSEKNGRIETALDPANTPPATPSPTICKTAAECAPFLSAYSNAVAAYASIVDGRRTIYQPDRNNVGAHFGFAWDPAGDGKTSLRAGYGVYYDTILGSVVSQSRNVFPNEIPFVSDSAFYLVDGVNVNSPAAFAIGGVCALKGCPTNTTGQLGGGPQDFATLVGALFYQDGKVSGPSKSGGLTFTLPENKLRTPYVQQWHLTLERAIGNVLLSAGYVGTKGAKLTRLVTPNGGYSVTPTQHLAQDSDPAKTPKITFDNPDSLQIAIARSNPNLGGYQIYSNSANSNYHALQLEARKRFSQGVVFTSAYTWSHAIDDVSDVTDMQGATALPQDSLKLRAERGDASFDVRHRFAGSLVVDLPFYRGQKRGAAVLLGGWQIASSFLVRSGQPFTLLVPFDANHDGNLNDRPATTTGLTFIDQHGQQRIALADPKNLPGPFFSTANPASGSVGRNTVRADGLVNWDMAVNKKFTFTESSHLDFRAEFFNVINRSNFGVPVRTIGDPGFGYSTNTVTPPRVIQFALKLAF